MEKRNVGSIMLSDLLNCHFSQSGFVNLVNVLGEVGVSAKNNSFCLTIIGNPEVGHILFFRVPLKKLS